MKEYFDEDREIGDGICGLKMMKLKMREKTGGIIINPRGAAETVEKWKLNSSCKAEGKPLYKKELNILGKHLIRK